MAWISWSRTWATKRTTTTSRKPPRCKIPEVQLEEYAFKFDAKYFAASSSTRTFPIGERYPVSKKLIRLLRHGSLPREDDGAMEFWRIKDDLQQYFLYCHHWSDEKWKKSMARGGGNKERYQYCTDSSGEILHLRALQGHSGRNHLDPLLLDSVLIPDDFFEYNCHVGCAINSHSITNSGLTPGGQNLSKRQTVFFCLWILWTWHESTPSCTVQADSVEETSKHGVLGRHQTCSKERIEVLSNTIERHHPHTPSQLFPEGYSDGNWRNHTRKSLWITSTASEDFLEKNWMKELGPEVARQAEGSQPTQPNPNPNRKKTGRPHGNRHGKTEAQKKHFIAHNLRRRCIKKNLEGIHDRFQKDFKKFVTHNSELIELKKYASRPTRTRRKISPIACRPKSIWDMKRPGLSRSTHLDDMHRWNSDQTSVKH